MSTLTPSTIAATSSPNDQQAGAVDADDADEDDQSDQPTESPVKAAALHGRPQDTRSTVGETATVGKTDGFIGPDPKADVPVGTVSPDIIPNTAAAPSSHLVAGDSQNQPAADSSAPSPPTAQLGHALAAVHTQADGSTQVRILLNPAELGSVQVRIIRSHDGTANVLVAAERSETLQSLQADVGHLHQALDRAGIPEQRSIAFHLVTTDMPAGGPSSMPDSAGQGASNGSRQQPRQENSSFAGHGSSVNADPVALSADVPGMASLRRVGVNITA